jgi:hypothetical protein
MDREKVIKDNAIRGLQSAIEISGALVHLRKEHAKAILELLKEQEKKEIKLHKKHVLTLNRNDEFRMRKLYESVCEKLLDEGEMAITRTDNHENVEFVFYMVND